jgi:hypothetical protein
MMINDAIRNASSEHTVYFLLTAYIDSLQFSARLPEYVTALPVSGLQDLDWRFEKLFAELEMEIGRPESPQLQALQEAVNIFEAAVTRLRRLLDEDATQGVIMGGNANCHVILNSRAA